MFDSREKLVVVMVTPGVVVMVTPGVMAGVGRRW